MQAQNWRDCTISRGSSHPRDWTRVSCIAGRFFTVWVTREAPYTYMRAKLLRLCPTPCDPMDWDLQPAWLLCPWDSPGKNTGVGCHALCQGIFPTQGSNLCLSPLLHWQVGTLPLAPPGKPPYTYIGWPKHSLGFFYNILYMCVCVYIYTCVYIHNI